MHARTTPRVCLRTATHRPVAQSQAHASPAFCRHHRFCGKIFSKRKRRVCLRVVLCGKQGMEGAAAEVVVVGADGSETSFTFDALVHSEDGESMHADPHHSGRPPNLVKRACRTSSQTLMALCCRRLHVDQGAVRQQRHFDRLCADQGLAGIRSIPHSLCLAWAQATRGEQMLIFSLLRALSASLARPCACLPSSPAPPARTPCHASASTSASLPRECQCL